MCNSERMTSTPDSATAKMALGIARDTALTLAKGPAATGFVVTRKGVSMLRSRRAQQRAGGSNLQVSQAKRQKSSRFATGRRAGLILALSIVAAAAVAFSRSRRTEVPPPAAQPPGLGTPSTNGHHAAATSPGSTQV